MICNTWVPLDIIRTFLNTGCFMVFFFFFGLFVRRAFSFNSEIFIGRLPCGSFVLVGDAGNNNKRNEIVCYVRK